MSQSPKRPYSLAEAHGTLRIWGGSGEGEGSGQPNAGGEGSGEGTGEGTELTDEQKALKEAQDKADAAEKRAKDAEKKAKDAEKSLQDKEREGMEEHDKLKADHTDLQAKYDKLVKLVETSVIDSHIQNLSSAKDKNGQPKYNWQDVEAVRAFIDREQIDIDLDNGTVNGIENQLKDIATKRPYLLVTKQEQDGGNQPPPPGGPATGSHPTGGTVRQRETDRQKLGAKYRIPGFVGAGNVRPGL